MANDSSSHPLLHVKDQNDKNKKSLLTIPLSDILRNSSSEIETRNSDLLLMQIPPNLMGTFFSNSSDTSTSSCYIVGASPNEEEHGDTTTTANLVMESVGETFGLHRAETSNALILFPPPTSSMTTFNGRLLGKPTCSFLEFRPFHLNRHKFRDFILRGKNTSVQNLSHALQCSETQILRELHRIETAFSVEGEWGLMDEEMHLEIKNAVVEAVIENNWDEVDDEPRDLELVIKEVIQRLSSAEEEKPWVDMVRHCISTLATETTPKVLFDMEKLAQWIGRTILSQSSTAIYPLSTFLTEWKRRLPHNVPCPPISSLIGVALVDSSSLVYFPRDQLSIEPSQRFRRLFQQRESWLLEDLLPYVEPLTEDNRVKELLLKYTRVVAEDGKQWYRQR